MSMETQSLVATRIRCWSVLLLLLAGGCGGSGGNTASNGYAIGQPANAVLVNTSANAIGRASESGNGLSRTFTQYDVRGRPTALQHVMDNWSYVYSNTYGYPQAAVSGPGTVITAATFPDNEVVSYTYDAGDEQQAVTATPPGGAAQPIISKVIHNVRGQTTEVDFGNGAAQFHTYNDTTDQHLAQIYTTLNGTQQQYTYTFDANENVTAVTDSLGYATASYAYDSLDRLTGGTWAYGYDNIGNLTSKEGAGQTYTNAAHPHALTTAAGLTYTYDANGNLTSRSDGMALLWNAENMPIQVSGGAATTPTQKFFLGEALWKKAQAGTTTYYLPSMRVENGVPRKYYGSFAERDTDGSLKFYQGDHLGSSTLVTDSNGQVVRRASYKPYGEDRSVPVASFTPENQFNFKEKERDGSGFYDYGAREYNPATGRFLSADSVDTDGLNRYAYVRNNPLRYADPTGHAAQGVVGEQGYEDANGVCHVGPLVPHHWVTAAPSLDEVQAQQRAFQAQGAELAASLTELQWAPIRGAVLSTLGRVPGAILNGVEAVQDAKDHRWGALAWDLVGVGLSVNPSLPGEPAGKVILTGTQATKNEISAAEIYASKTGYRVILRDPVNHGQSGRTSDGLVGGWKYRYDIMRPNTANDTNIIRRMRDKRDQAVGIILDLRDSKVDPGKLSNAIDRVGGDGHGTFQEIFIIQREQ
jgi:RHS repeat-associated protein